MQEGVKIVACLENYFFLLPELLHGEERKVWGDGGYQARQRRSNKPLPKPRT